MAKECGDCRYWSFDMDLDPYCVHPNSGIFGTDLRVMRNTIKTQNMRGKPCGPEGLLFKAHAPK